MQGPGYLDMSEEDCLDGQMVESIVNWNEATTASLPDKISFVSYHQKMWVIAKHSKDPFVIVLGIKDPKFLQAHDMSRVMDASMWP
jgi:hypothetical protein